MTDIMFTKAFEAFIDVAKEWEGFERFIPNMEVFKSSYLSKMLKTYTPNRSGFGYNVLNHADFHTKNLLLKKSADGSDDDFYIVSL